MLKNLEAALRSHVPQGEGGKPEPEGLGPLSLAPNKCLKHGTLRAAEVSSSSGLFSSFAKEPKTGMQEGRRVGLDGAVLGLTLQCKDKLRQPIKVKVLHWKYQHKMFANNTVKEFTAHPRSY